MKTSWKRCVEFCNMAAAHLKRTENRDTKLKYAINRMSARIQKQQESVTERLTDIEIDYCLTEKRGEHEVIVRDAQGNLQYTKENIKARNKANREYLNSNEIELDPYFATALPTDLNEFEIEAFSGFVIKVDDADRLLEECEARAEEIATVPAQQNGNQGAVSAIA